MGKTIAIVNQKGGVGKTTTAINLSSCISEKGKKVLLIDADPQGNATLGLGFDNKAEEQNSIYDVLIKELPISDIIKETAVPGLFLAPSNINLTGAEVELIDLEGREKKLKESIKMVKDLYDFIFIDAPPSLGLITLNTLVACDSVLIPLQAEFYAMDGLAQLLNTISLVKESLNSGIYIEGVLITMFDSRTRLAIQVVEEIKNKFKNAVYDVFIPRNVKLSEAPSFGQPINIYDKNSKGAEAYEKLADEILSGKE